MSKHDIDSNKNMLEEISSQRQLNLKKQNYWEIIIIGDVNCFFRCLSFHLEKSEGNYDFYRNKIYHYIKKNKKN